MATSEVVAVAGSEVGGVIQSQIVFRTTVRVSSKQRTGASDLPELYPAPLARGILSSSSSSSDAAFPFTKNKLHVNIEFEMYTLTNC